MTWEKIFVWEKLRISVKQISVYKVIETLVAKTDNQQTLSAMLHKIFNDFILIAMLLHQWCHRLLPKQLRNYPMFY